MQGFRVTIFLVVYCEVFIPGVLIPGVFIPGLFIPGVIYSGVIYSWSYLFMGVFIQGLFIPGVFFPGVFIPGVFIPSYLFRGCLFMAPNITSKQSEKSRIILTELLGTFSLSFSIYFHNSFLNNDTEVTLPSV